MLIKIYPQNPDQRQILKVVDILQSGGVIIFPTDTVYGLGCSITKPKAIEKMARIKGIKIEKANFSFLCHDLSNLADYAKHVNNPVFKLMKSHLPGPYTFILEAGSRVPKVFRTRKKTIGIRIPDNKIISEIIVELGNPLLSSSIHDDDKLLDYTTDPELIHEHYQNIVDCVIDGGYGNNIPSTIIDCTLDEPQIIREGMGEI